jgi:uncharacterized protein (DUF2147 family)
MRHIAGKAEYANFHRCPATRAEERTQNMMRHLLSSLLLSAALTSGAEAQVAEDAFGLWFDASTGGQLEILKCGEGLCAKIAGVPPGKEGAKDINNQDPALRERLLLGLMIMENAQKTDENKWEGTVYDRVSGKLYSGKVVVKTKDTIEIIGCKMAILCRATPLTRVVAQQQ